MLRRRPTELSEAYRTEVANLLDGRTEELMQVRQEISPLQLEPFGFRRELRSIFWREGILAMTSLSCFLKDEVRRRSSVSVYPSAEIATRVNRIPAHILIGVNTSLSFENLFDWKLGIRIRYRQHS